MKSKKGFTLIELLAVIIILAIIALIAIPVVLNMIETSRRGAAKDSAYGFIEAIEYNNGLATLATDASVEGYSMVTNTDAVAAANALGSHLKEKKPTGGTLTYDSNGKVTSATDLCFYNYRVQYNGKEVIKIDKGCNSSSNNNNNNVSEVNFETDTTVKAPESFATDSWATIAENTTSDKYHVGDTKCVTVDGITSGKNMIIVKKDNSY